jgi:RNA polymerase sigma-70 factor (ECF subfamily)
MRDVAGFQRLLDAARAGDRDALGALWRRWNPAVLRYLGARRTPDHEDVASAVWLDVARGLGRFAGDEADFRGWLFTIAHRRAVDEARRAARRPDASPVAADAVVTVGTPEDDVVSGRGLAEVIELMRHLPAEQADVVMLRVVADLDVATVAAIIGRSPAAVRLLAHRGLTRLADLLPDAGDFDRRGAAAATRRGARAMKAVT